MDKRSGWSFEEDPMEEMEDLAEASIENLAQHFFDSYERENAAFRRSSGLKVTVIREELGDCCSWCADLAGVYEYGSEPKDVWARHANCRCMVVTKTERGTYQDAWSRKEYQSQREARIAREEEIREEQEKYAEQLKSNSFKINAGRNVTAEYIENAKPFRGKTVFEEGLEKEKHANEITMGKWLKETFGGDIVYRSEANKPEGIKQPDYLWRGKLWDLKTVSTEKSANSAIRKGLKQINSNPGGILLDYTGHEVDHEKLGSVIRERMKWHPNAVADIIIKEGERFTVIRYK